MANKGYGKGTNLRKGLNINSSDRIQREHSSDSNFTIDFGMNLQQVKRVSVNSVIFNNVFYNVWETTLKSNNYFTMIVVGGAAAGTYSIKVPQGHYDAPSLMEAIGDAVMDATSDQIDITFELSVSTNLVTAWISTFPVGTTSVRFLLTNANAPSRQDGWPFGLIGESTGDFFMAMNLDRTTFTNMPSLNEPAVAYLMSSQIAPSGAFDEKGSYKNVILPIPITAPYLGRNVFDCKVDELCDIDYEPARNLDRVDFQLCDHNFDLLDLRGNSLNINLKVWIDSF
jgi:hypothetical protein